MDYLPVWFTICAGLSPISLLYFVCIYKWKWYTVCMYTKLYIHLLIIHFGLRSQEYWAIQKWFKIGPWNMLWWNNYDSIPPNLEVHDAYVLDWSKAILLYKTTFEKASTWLWWKSIQNHQICFKLLLLSLATNGFPNSRSNRNYPKLYQLYTSNRKTNTLTGTYRDLSSICLLLNLIQFPCNFWWKCQVLSFWRGWLVPFGWSPFFHNPGNPHHHHLPRYGMTGPLSFIPMASRNVPKAPALGPCCFAKWENLFWLWPM